MSKKDLKNVGKWVVAPFVMAHQVVWSETKRQIKRLFAEDTNAVDNTPSPSTVRSSKAPARYAVGKFSTGGVLAWAQEQEGEQDEDEWLHCVYVLSEGAIAGIDAVYLDEKLISTYDDNVQHAFIQNSTVANAFLLANCKDFTSTQIGKNLAYYRISYKYNPEVFAGGIPEVRIVGRGRTDIYDPRTSTSNYSANPALLSLWYLRTVLKVPDSEIIFSHFSDAANICDEVVTNPADSGTSIRYQAGGIIGDDEKPVDVLNKLMASCAGKLLRVGGKWSIQVGAYYGPSQFTITESMVIGDVSGSTEIDNDSATNTVHGKFIDPTQAYSETDYPPVSQAAWVAEDGAELASDLNLLYVQNPYQAQRLASIALRKRRTGGTVTLDLNGHGYNCRPGVVVTLDLPKLNLDGEFIVTDWGLSADGACNVSLEAYDLNIFDDAVGRPYKPLGFISLPSGGIAAPTNLAFAPSVNAEVSQGLLTWTPPQGIVEYYGITVRNGTGSVVRTFQATGTASSAQLNGLDAGTYAVAIYAKGAIGQSGSVGISITVQAPPTPESITTATTFNSITITPRNTGDLNGGTYEYYYALATTSDPLTANYLGQGDSFTHNGLAYDTEYHYYVRSINAYGKSAFSYVAASTNSNPQRILEVISGEIKVTDLYSDLQTEIGKIGGLGVDLTTLQGQVTDLGTSTNQHIGLIQDELAGLDDDLIKLEDQVTGLGVDLTTLQGQVTDLDTSTSQHIGLLQGELNALEQQIKDITGAPEWSALEAYLEGEIVSFDGALYRAEQNVPIGTAVTNEAYWTKIGDYASIGDAVTGLAIRVNDLEVELTEIDGKVSAQQVATNSLIAQVRPKRADGEKADALKGWQTAASFTEQVKVQATENKALSQRITNAEAEVGENRAGLSSLEQVVADEKTSTANRISSLTTDVQGNTSAISDLDTAFSDEKTSTASRFSTLETDVQGNTSSIEDLDTAFSDEKTSTANRFSTLETDVQGNTTAISDLDTAFSDEQTATASRFSTLETDVQGNTTAITNLDIAFSDEQTSTASRFSTLETDVQGNTADITDLTQAFSDEETATATRFSDMNTRVGTAESAITDLDTAFSDEKTSTANRFSNLSTRVGDAESDISTLEQTVATESEASALRTDRLSASLRPKDGNGAKAAALAGWANTASFVEQKRVQVTETKSLSERITTAQAQTNDNKAGLQILEQAVTTETSALSQRISTSEIAIGENSAAVQVTQKAVGDIEDELGASLNIKLNVTQDGKYYAAGMGIGIENTPTGMQSQILFTGDRFAFLNADGSETFPFLIDGNETYIDSAVIKDAAITNAKIGDVIQSDDYSEGVSGWKIDKKGDMEMNDAVFRGVLGVTRFDSPNARVKSYLNDSYGHIQAMSKLSRSWQFAEQGKKASEVVLGYFYTPIVDIDDYDDGSAFGMEQRRRFLATANSQSVVIQGHLEVVSSVWALANRYVYADNTRSSWLRVYDGQMNISTNSSNPLQMPFNIYSTIDVANLVERANPVIVIEYAFTKLSGTADAYYSMACSMQYNNL